MPTTVTQLDSPPPGSPEKSTSVSHVGSLDGLRGIAVILVLITHSGAPFSGSGMLGVDLFFVLSGFLITTLMLKEREKKGFVSLPKFWGRRFVRLMPVYWLYVGTVMCLELFGPYPMKDHGGYAWELHIASMWLYFVNYLPLGGFNHFNEITYHLWSLSVEEQFYLAWPLLFVVASKLGILTHVIWAIVGFVIFRLVTVDSWVALMLHLDTRGFGIVLGCAAGVTANKHESLWRFWLQRIAGPLFTIVAFGALLILAFPLMGFSHTSFAVLRGFTPAFSLLMAILVAGLWYAENGRFASVLSWGPLAYTGRISYGLYIYQPAAHYVTWHFLLSGIEHWDRYPKFGLRVLVFFACSYMIAMASYHLYEARFLTLKKYLR